MIPLSGSGRSAPRPAPAWQRKKILELRTPPVMSTPAARCGAERPHREGGIIPPLLGRSVALARIENESRIMTLLREDFPFTPLHDG